MWYTVSVADLVVCVRCGHILLGLDVFVIHHACIVLICNVLTYSSLMLFSLWPRLHSHVTKRFLSVQTQSDRFVDCCQLMKLTCNKYQWLSLITSSLLCVHPQCLSFTNSDLPPFTRHPSVHAKELFRQQSNTFLPETNTLMPLK